MRNYKTPPTQVGDKSGKLTVLENTDILNGTIRFKCLCSCGTILMIKGSNFRSGSSKSCGCSKYDSKNTTHGQSKNPLYKLYRGMLDRCYDKSNTAYNNYGGRGITVCDRWKESPEAFFQDVGERPTTKHELDRRENDKGYYPGNCVWSTKKENSRNKRTNRKLIYQGVTMTIAEASERTGVSPVTIRAYLEKNKPNLHWTPKVTV